MQHPSCVSVAWLDSVGDLKNNPRALHACPFNDGSLHWIDKKGTLLCMAFPAILDLNGKYGRTGPYFSLGGEQGSRSLTFIRASVPLADLTSLAAYNYDCCPW